MAAQDVFQANARGLEGPISDAAAVTPNDANDLTYATRAINVATDGFVKVTTVGNDTVTLYVAAGIWFPIRASRIWATGTTATGIVGGW
ncbi:MAG: hypothetical protein KGL25_03170 [Gammaproteobacteria bacterium]|nr:hypothetical protein [Gammaproteobacteria bacterium]